MLKRDSDITAKREESREQVWWFYNMLFSGSQNSCPLGASQFDPL
jgi:hypothetical protein